MVMTSILENTTGPIRGSGARFPIRESHPAFNLEQLYCAYATTRDPKIREALILYHQRLVRSIAVRFVGGEEALEDLIQVGNIGLINALDRYDPSQGTRFSTFATPTITGEIHRHFRDKSASIKIPRWLQELQHAIRRVNTELTSALGRAPTSSEMGKCLDVPEEHILLAIESQEASNILSLDTHLDGRYLQESTSMQDIVGQKDRLLCEFEHFGDLRGALDALGQREREVIALRFYDDLSQAKIAGRLNISQMHVSRLQQRALLHLRDLLTDEPRAPSSRKCKRSPR